MTSVREATKSLSRPAMLALDLLAVRALDYWYQEDKLTTSPKVSLASPHKVFAVHKARFSGSDMGRV
jgi:hypothetical protein